MPDAVALSRSQARAVKAQMETSFYDDASYHTVSGLCWVTTRRACDNGMQPFLAQKDRRPVLIREL